MSNAELTKLAGLATSGTPNSSYIGGASSQDLEHNDADDLVKTVDLAVTHIKHLNHADFEKLLSDAAVALPRLVFLQRVILPIFQKTGELWATGKIKIINEHMASAVVRAILWDMLRSTEVPETAPRVVIATPVGQWHEFGALTSALAASQSGWQVIYFGPNLPSQEIAYAVKKFKAKALTISVCHRLDDTKLVLEFKNLRRLVGWELPIFIGGSGSVVARRAIESIKAIWINDLRRYRDKLESID